MGGAIEPITEAAMAHLGLVNRPVVAQGGIDAHIGMVGADTLAPGDVLLIGGISAVNLFLFAGIKTATRLLGALSPCLGG